MTTTMAALISTTESKIVYVWAPYSVFLLIIFIVLAVSFVRHTRRVLRRRRVMLDYMEANVLCKRPRIVRMFTSSISRANRGELGM
nr:hypothetical protein BaRGS_013910 [Batillaria attramentaria]